MVYFAIQVWTGKEDEFLKLLRANWEGGDFPELFVPKRSMPIRRKGKPQKEIRPIFPGYVFLGEPEPSVSPNTRWMVRHTANYLRFLPDGPNPRPVSEKDRRLLGHFMSFGCIADTSKVTFDDHDRIVVVEGALKGLEGHIVKVDKRKRRAKIRLDMCEDSFQIDLAFEILDRPAKSPEKADGES